ncbi:RsmD family RNA methyltransferase [Thermoflavifilum thermophilum]|uniref:16S rRNA (Guanine(966)-N(2))-methyltransferase RsmD n=1 Tax=Thermoflavifilum thermophilum TaxID=1393122 RepID=A0A1I7NKZ5_9BACT|nr:RsmD family RNA methyltransferase [Thermoflavifilum thermophilum]SFV35315.1 16S rRNA (guanine(966)-N(2))-methyltransferase RsmD [Thermoflavifilum thermophilum]
MRIISGSWKGRKFSPPAGFRSRPTSDRAKEGLFNILQHRLDLSGMEALDLFAGTGSVGYELASRGAQRVVMVDHHRKVVQFIQQQIRQWGMTTCEAIQADAWYFIKHTPEKFDLIFADPPYEMEDVRLLPDTILQHGLLKKDGWLVLEHIAQIHFDHHPHLMFSRRYGKTMFSFFRDQPQSSSEPLSAPNS